MHREIVEAGKGWANRKPKSWPTINFRLCFDAFLCLDFCLWFYLYRILWHKILKQPTVFTTKKNFLLHLPLRVKSHNLCIVTSISLSVLLVACFEAKHERDWDLLMSLWARSKRCSTKLGHSTVESYLESN